MFRRKPALNGVLAVLITLLVPWRIACAQGATAGGEPPEPPKTGPLPKGSVTGHVTCDDTHGPARGARVILFAASSIEGAVFGGQQPLFATTHLDGSFLVPHVPPGEYLAIALATGYFSPLDGVTIENGGDAKSQQQRGEKILKLLRETAPSVTVAVEGSARVDINIQRGAVLAGRVLYSDGTPASEISVQIEDVNAPKPDTNATSMIEIGSLLRIFTLPHNLTTDDLGDFRLAGIAPGTYRLAVPQSFDTQSFQDAVMAVFNPAVQQSGKLTIYSGNTLHQKDAKTYEVRAGDTVSGIEVILPLNGLHTVKGTASGKNGILLGAGTLELTDTVDDAINFRTIVHGDGEFAFFGIPEGSYNLKLTNGFTYDTPLPDSAQEELPPQNRQAFKPTHAFADLTQPVLVGTDDIDNLVLTPAETKLPDLQKPGPQNQPDQPDQPDQPNSPSPNNAPDR